MLGVVVGRFQTPYLHNGHFELLKYARNKSDKLLILIGVSSATGTDKDPMDFETRKCLFETFENIIVLPIYDMPCDKDWSNQLDSIINNLGFDDAIIFGSRDNSILNYYYGKHNIDIMISNINQNATEIRKHVKIIPSQDFREGVIYHTQKRYPIVYSTVDIVIQNDNDEFLLGKKGNKWAFVGGFVDKEDNSLLQAANRELFEETGIETDLKYLTSIKIFDPRYIKTKDSIMTNIFLGRYNKLPKFNDIKDLEFKDFGFFSIKDLNSLLQECHKPILSIINKLKG